MGPSSAIVQIWMGYLGLASSRYWQWGGVAYLEHAASRLDLGPDAPPGHKGARERRTREKERHRVVEHPAHPLSIIAEAEPVLPMPPRRLGNDACRAILLGGAVPRKTCQGGGRVRRPTASALDRYADEGIE